MQKGICEVCGFADDSYRIEEDGVVLKVCKFCHDGYIERKEAYDASSAVSEEQIPFDDIPPEDLKEIERELASQRAERKVATLDEEQLGQILAPTDDDKRVLGNVRRRQLRAEKRAAAEGKEVAWLDADESDDEEEETVATVLPAQGKEQPRKRKPVDKKVEKIRAEAAEQKKLLRMRIQGILNTLEQVIESDEPEALMPLAPIGHAPASSEGIAKKEDETTATTEEATENETPTAQTDETTESEAPPAQTDETTESEAPPAQEEEATEDETPPTEETEEATEDETPPAQEEETTESEAPPAQKEETTESEAPPAQEEETTESEAPPTEETEEATEDEKPSDEPVSVAASETQGPNETNTDKESDMATKTTPTREQKLREKIHAQAHQTIDDERIRITSPEVELRRDKRPKTNFDVATSEYVGGVRFLDVFHYVLHRVSYTVFLSLVVLAVCTVSFVIDGWQHGLILLGGGVGAIGLGFLLMWYLSHCYTLDRRALLLRIRQQEILFDSMDTECYRELRTKFTMIKALGWLLTRLSVLLPLLVVVGGNVAAVIVCFRTAYYWLFPVISAGATVASVLVYYIFKFSADCVSYTLDRERNQQIEQQTLLDILGELRRHK